MKKKVLRLCCSFFLFWLALAGTVWPAQAKSVVVVSVQGEIDDSQAALVHRAYESAAATGADAVLMEIDTFGGRVDAAVKIRDTILAAPMETICYIKNRAWSAGALIAIAHQHIIMAPGGSIGAAEPIPATEKTIAALKAEFAATANRAGRNPAVAEAMVDKTMGLPGYANPGQILALADYQAQQTGYADGAAPDRRTALGYFGLQDAEQTEFAAAWTDKTAGWLSDPVVQSILVAVIVLAVLTEIKTAGMGAAALVGLLAALLLFGGEWLTGMGDWLPALAFAAGVLLLLIEMHVPGFGLFGLGGMLSILASFFLVMGGNVTALNLLALSLVAAIALFALIVKRLPSSRFWSRLTLETAETSQNGFVSGLSYAAYLGREGTAITLLRPAGVVEVDGVHLDVVAEGQYIPSGTKVRIVEVKGSRIVVRRLEEK